TSPPRGHPAGTSARARAPWPRRGASRSRRLGQQRLVERGIGEQRRVGHEQLAVALEVHELLAQQELGPVEPAPETVAVHHVDDVAAALPPRRWGTAVARWTHAHEVAHIDLTEREGE